MQSIRRLSLAFIMFSVFSVSYLVKPVFAEIVGASLTDNCEQHARPTGDAEQVNCLRSLLSETAPNFITPSKDGLGNWGCSSSDQAQHIDCLKNLLYQHTNGGSGMSQVLDTHEPAEPILQPHGAPPATTQHIDSPSVTQHLDGRVGDLENQLSAATAAQEPLNARIADLEGQLSAASAAQGPLNVRIADLEGQLSAASAAQGPLNTRIADLERRLSAASEAAGRHVATITCLEERYAVLMKIHDDNQGKIFTFPPDDHAGSYALTYAGIMIGAMEKQRRGGCSQ